MIHDQLYKDKDGNILCAEHDSTVFFKLNANALKYDIIRNNFCDENFTEDDLPIYVYLGSGQQWLTQFVYAHANEDIGEFVDRIYVHKFDPVNLKIDSAVDCVNVDTLAEILHTETELYTAYYQVALGAKGMSPWRGFDGHNSPNYVITPNADNHWHKNNSAYWLDYRSMYDSICIKDLSTKEVFLGCWVEYERNNADGTWEHYWELTSGFKDINQMHVGVGVYAWSCFYPAF